MTNLPSLKGCTVTIVCLPGTGIVHKWTNEIVQNNKLFTYRASSFMSDRTQAQEPQKGNVEPWLKGIYNSSVYCCRLFEMGFQEQLNEIIQRLPESRQTLLFSATLPKLLVEFAKAGLNDPTLIRLDVDTKLSENLKVRHTLNQACWWP